MEHDPCKLKIALIILSDFSKFLLHRLLIAPRRSPGLKKRNIVTRYGNYMYKTDNYYRFRSTDNRNIQDCRYFTGLCHTKLTVQV